MGSSPNLTNTKIESLLILKQVRKDKKLKWKCLCDCGNTTYKTTNEFKRKDLNNSCGCKNKAKRYTFKDYKKQISIKYKNIVCENYINMSKSCEHTCSFHGTFYATPTKMLKKYTHGCRKCAYEAASKKMSHSKELILKMFKNKHKDTIEIAEGYKGRTNIKHWFKCKKCNHKWITVFSSVLNKTGCPNCCRSRTYSKLEKIWVRFMKNNVNSNIVTSEEDRCIKIQLPDKIVIPDGYDPITKTVYEFHGDYWHGKLNSTKYKENYFIGNLSRKELNKKTRKREKDLLRAGYKVVYCWESDYKKYLKGRFYFRPKPFKRAKLSNSPYCK